MRCAICSKKINRALVCKDCKKDYDLQSEWVTEMIEMEKSWRNMERRDIRHGAMTFTDYTVFKDGEAYDGWDVLDGEIGSGKTNEPFVNAMGSNDSYFQNEELEILYEEIRIYELADHADLTEGEFNALWIYVFPPHSLRITSEEFAEMLSRKEGREVSAQAFRRRLSDVRKKLKAVLENRSDLS
jgi:hypothetical protein